MVLAAVPDDSYLMRIDLSELPGRQVRALGSPARLLVAWVTSQDVLGAGWQWARLSPDAVASGLQPVLICGLPCEPARRWDEGEFCEPQDTAAIDRLGAALLLDGWWREYPPIWSTECYGLMRRLYPDRRSARVRGQRQYCPPSARANGMRRCLGLTLR